MFTFVTLMAKDKKPRKITRQVRIDEAIVAVVVQLIKDNGTGQSIGGYFESLHLNSTKKENANSNTSY